VDRWLGQLHDIEAPLELRMRSDRQWEQDPLPALDLLKVEQLQKWANGWNEKPQGFTWENRAQHYSAIFERRFSRQETGRAWLRRLILKRPVTVGYHLLSRILLGTEHKVVITTNFDRLVEDAIAIAEGITVLPFGSKELAGYVTKLQATPVVAKIHGDVQLDTYNAAKEIADLDDEWKEALRNLLRRYTPIVVGYGGNDPGFMRFLIEESSQLLVERPIYWTSRRPEQDATHSFMSQLAKQPCFQLVRIPGFEELMVKLVECWDFPSFEDLIQRRTERIVADYRAASVRARQALEGRMVRIEDPQVPSLITTAKSIELPAPAQRTWKDWRDAADSVATPAQKGAILAQSLESIPDSPALRARAAAVRSERNPADNQPTEQALVAYEDAVRRLGPDHEETMDVKHSLGAIHLARGEFDHAEPLFREAFEARKRVLGPEHPDTLYSQNAFAFTLSCRGDHKGAIERLDEVLIARKQTLGPEHSDTLWSMNNLANAFAFSGNHARAAELHEGVLQIQIRSLGKEHPHTLVSLSNFASFLIVRGEFSKALALEREAFDAFQTHYGEDHPFTLTSRYNQGAALLGLGERDESILWLREAFERRERVLGSDHPDTLEAQRTLDRAIHAEGTKGGIVNGETCNG
jgi:tetratricopeptide (TPR) repeat protein